MAKRIVLLGGGHAHLFVASQAADFRACGLELFLVDPGMLWYSGMATGMLGGFYEPEDDTIDLCALCQKNNVTFHQTRAKALQCNENVVTLETGASIPYDILSLNVGSCIATDSIKDPEELAWTVKPIPNLLELRLALERHLKQKNKVRVGLVGAGPAGCEIAANVQALSRRSGGSSEITLFSKSERILPRFSKGTADKLSSVLKRRGIKIELGTRALEIHRAGDGVLLKTKDGAEHIFDEVVLATGLLPSPTVRELGLGENGLHTDKTLAASGHSAIFGAGDCISFSSRELPKVGVFGVRQAPVLKDNLIAAALGRPLREYNPQKHYLIILNLGDGTGFAIRGAWHWYGKLSFLIKNYIDRRFMAKFQS